MNTLPRMSGLSPWLLPVAVSAGVIAVVAAVAFGVSAAHSRDDATIPPVLHLTTVAGSSQGVSATVEAGASGPGDAPGSSAGRGGWQLDAKLPIGPSSGQVHLLAAGMATRDFVRTLAGSLGMSGQPRHLEDGWYLISGTAELSVSELAGRHWTYSNQGCITGPVLDPGLGAACAFRQSTSPSPVVPSASGSAGSDRDAPSIASTPVPSSEVAPVAESVARRVARPVLLAAAVSPDSASVLTRGATSSVVFSSTVDGLTVLGLQTQVSIDAHGQIVDASGWLAASTTGSSYPLISARQGYDQLLAQPQPMTLSSTLCRIVPGTQGCAPIPDRVITAAALGLSLTFSTEGNVVLVPAWLFQVRSDPTPVAVLAVERAYLGEPKTTEQSPTTGSVPGSIGWSNGMVGPAQNTGEASVAGHSEVMGAPATVPKR
jgi:hypothetical protein